MRRARITIQREPNLLLGLHCIDSENDDIRFVDSYVSDIIIAKHFDRIGYLYMLVGNLEQKHDLANYGLIRGPRDRSVLIKRVE